MVSVFRFLKLRIPSHSLCVTRYRGRLPDSATEDVVAREADAFTLLAQINRVRLCIEPHQSELRRLTGAHVNDSFVELSSSELKKIIRQLKSSVCVIQGDGDLPLFKVCARSQEPKRSDRKTGIKLSHGERGKTLNMSSQIDDHMLSVRVKQIEALLDANYVINVFVKLRRNELPKCESGEDKEKGELAKMMYNIIAQRFVTAFSKIPSATVRLLERPQMTEIAAIIKRTENS